MATFFAAYTARSAYMGGVGSRIRDVAGFEAALSQAVDGFDFTLANKAVRTKGQGCIRLDSHAGTCSAGVGHPVDSDDAYVIRCWRGRRKAFLRREHAVVAETLAVVVYTRTAFLRALDGPDTPAEVAKAELTLLAATEATNGPVSHVVVAVLAGAGPEALSPGRLVSNLAGGNADALAWSGDEIRAKARESQAYAEEWETVSD